MPNRTSNCPHPQPLSRKRARGVLCLGWACALAATLGWAGEDGISPVPGKHNLLENGGFETCRPDGRVRRFSSAFRSSVGKASRRFNKFRIHTPSLRRFKAG